MQELINFIVGIFIAIYYLFQPPLNTVSGVNVDKYVGTWYEISRLPNNFEDANCRNITATYSKNSDGTIGVINKCELNGNNDTVTGTAYPQDKRNSKLFVVFPFFQGIGFPGPYWILKLGPIEYEQYSYAIVGEKSRRFYWILSRSPTMNPELLQELKEFGRLRGFPVDTMIDTPHDEIVK